MRCTSGADFQFDFKQLHIIDFLKKLKSEKS